MKKSDPWISMYAYYQDPLEMFIRDGIGGVLGKLTKKAALRSYFFIRYSENGTHIRLRLKPYTSHYQEVYDVARAQLTAYMKTVPSPESSTHSQNENNTHTLRPPHMIETVPYKPEIARYGGQYAISVAENHFKNSTDVVLTYLKQKRNHPYTARLSYALTLACCYYRAFSPYFSPHETAAYHALHGIARHKELQKKMEEIYTKTPKRTIEKIRSSATVGPKQKIKNSVVTHATMQFTKELSKTAKSLLSLEKNGRLEPPPCAAAHMYVHLLPIRQQRIWHIVSSYMHMTNNRLGIATTDEHLIAYYIFRALQK